MLRFDKVGFAFGREVILDGLSLQIEPGQLAVLLGSSGVGKTSVIRLAAGLLTPTKGTISNAFGRTAMVFQDPRLLPWASALDNAAFGLKAIGVPAPERRTRAAELLLRFGLGRSSLDKLPAELSRGMAQRVAVARALAVKPDLLLMDEPFNALDGVLRLELQDILRAEVDRSALAVLFVTHDIPEAVRLADRILALAPYPHGIAADLPHNPVHEPEAIFHASAALLQDASIRQALSSGMNARKTSSQGSR